MLTKNKGIIYAGINRATAAVQAKKNDHLRVFQLRDEEVERKPSGDGDVDVVHEESLDLVTTKAIFSSGQAEDYQKCTAVNADSSLLAVSNALEPGSLVVLALPSLKIEYTHVVKQGEISDLHFEPETGRHVVYVSNDRLVVLDAKTGAEVAHAQPPLSGAAFRKVRFADSHTIVAGVNQPRGKGITLAQYRFTASKAKVSATEPVALNDKLELVQQRVISSGSKITALDVSRAASGHIAFAKADLSVGIASLSNLKVQQLWANAHPFAVTSVAINPSGTLVASTSAGNTVILAELPSDGIFNRRQQVVYWTAASALLLVIMAVLLQYIVKSSFGDLEKFGLGGGNSSSNGVAKTHYESLAASSNLPITTDPASVGTLDSAFEGASSDSADAAKTAKFVEQEKAQHAHDAVDDSAAGAVVEDPDHPDVESLSEVTLVETVVEVETKIEVRPKETH